MDQNVRFGILFIYLFFRGVNYTYYEDEGIEDNLSDPTSIANYVSTFKCISLPFL